MFRIGFGTDIHRLVAGRRLVIGGIVIESDLGAEGHSDADVLLHAATDALLGALALGDIGAHFPNTDERWKNADSSEFLRYAVSLMRERGYVVLNSDSTISIEVPKLRPYIDSIRERLSSFLDIEASKVSVKAKTNEGLESIGRSEAVKAEVVILIGKVL